MLSTVPNGPVTNGVMTLGAPSEGGSVTDHGYDERLSPHVTPDSVTSSVTPDTNGPTPLNAHENGNDTQEHYNGGSSSVAEAATEEKSTVAEVAPLSEQELSEEKSEALSNKDEDNVEREEAPERECQDSVHGDNATGIPAEEKEAINTSREEEKQLLPSEEGELATPWQHVEIFLVKHVLCIHTASFWIHFL